MHKWPAKVGVVVHHGSNMASSGKWTSLSRIFNSFGVGLLSTMKLNLKLKIKLCCECQRRTNWYVNSQEKMKRMCRYQAEWAREFSWSAKPGNVFAAEWFLCRRSVSVAHGGRSDLVQHSKTESHKQAVHAANSTAINKFFVKANPTSGIDRPVCLHSQWQNRNRILCLRVSETVN